MRRAAGFSQRGAPVAVGLLLIGSFALVLHAGRDTTFFFDEWNFVTERRDWNLHVLLYAHNEHLSAVPVLVYKVLLETAGLDQYGAFRGVLALLNALVGLLLYAYAAPRVGRWAAVALTALVVFMGAGHMDLLWAFQIGFLASLACGLGALLAVDRETRRADLLAAVLLAVGLGSSSLGLPIAAAVALDLLLRRGWRRLWVVGVPAALYAAWYLRYGVGAADAANAGEVPRWLFEAAAGTMAALSGFGGTYGPVLALGLFALVGAALAAPGGPRPRLVALAALPLVFWAATALARADMAGDPDESRYLYPGGLFLALLIAEAGRGHRVPPRAVLPVAALLGVGVAANANELERGGDRLRVQAQNVTATLNALELLGREAVPEAARPNEVQVQLAAGAYFDTVANYGSSAAWSPRELPRAPAGLRADTDAALVRLGAAGVDAGGEAAAAGEPPGVLGTTGLAAAPAGPCVRATPSAGGAELAVAPVGDSLVVEAGAAPVGVRVARFADAFPEGGIGDVAAGARSTVRFKRDRSDRPWRVSLRSAAPFRACAAR